MGATPAGSLATGLIMGFLTEADAMTAIIPMSVSTVGGMPISALLRATDPRLVVLSELHGDPGDVHALSASRD